MTDPNNHKPMPARPGGGKPIPVRELTGESPPQPIAADVTEAQVEVDGVRWIVRVLGRSGRASGTAAHLLLLGFWEGDVGGEGPALEAMVAGRSLEGMSTEALEAAHSKASKPQPPNRKRTFFKEAGQGRHK